MINVYYPFYRHFKCIAGNCPMNCCADFKISFFKWEEKQFNTKLEWQNIDGKGNNIASYLDHDTTGWFCKSSVKGTCIFWGEDSLCNIQKRYGPNAMPSVCRTFPRVVTKYPNRMEYALDACCPVVAASVWSWEIGKFVTDGTPCGNESTAEDLLTERRNAAISILADETTCFHDCLEKIAEIFKCDNVRIPEIVLSDEKVSFIRKLTLVLIWENILRHEQTPEGNVIITLLLQFLTSFSIHLEKREYASRWEMSVDFSRNYVQFVKGTPIEPDDEKRFTDIIPE